MKNTAGIVLMLTSLLFVSFKGDKTERVNQRAVTRIKNEGLNNSQVMETLFELTDVNGPRLTGSTGMRNAELWAKKKLKGWGLKHVQIEPWGGFGKGWEINKCYVAMTAPYYQSLVAVPRAWTPGTNGLISGRAIWMKVDSLPDLRRYAGKLEGKVVVLYSPKLENKINFNADAKRLTDEDLEKLAQDPAKDIPAADVAAKPKTPPPSRAAMLALRRAIDSFMLEEGAIAVLSGGRGTMGTVFTSNGSSRAWNAKRVLPELETGYESLSRLIRLLQAGKKVNIEMDTRTTFLDADSTESNVVAEIPGVDPELKNELVIIGAHMDSWHAATGATDNGTGVAVMMEAVRILRALNVQPRRTIRIVLWSGEEQGLLGSRAYVKDHFADRMTMQLKPAHARVSAYYNLDNGAGKIRGIFMQGNEEVRPIFQAWLEPFKDLGAGTLTIRNTGSTDHISFDEVGIPGFQFIQDPLDYGTRTHHTNMDTYDRVNEEDLKQASVIIASFVYNTAMRNDMLPRKTLPQPAKQ